MWIAVLPFRLLITLRFKCWVLSLNVEAYEKEDEVNTTLVSGKVQFQYDSERGKKRMDLLPGEKITYNSISGEVFVSRAAVLSDISWKEGKIILYKTPD